MSFRVRRVPAPGSFVLLTWRIPARSAFLRDEMRWQWFVEKNAASHDGLGDYSAALEYEPSHLVRGIRTAKRSSIFLNTPT